MMQVEDSVVFDKFVKIPTVPQAMSEKNLLRLTK